MTIALAIFAAILAVAGLVCFAAYAIAAYLRTQDDLDDEGP